MVKPHFGLKICLHVAVRKSKAPKNILTTLHNSIEFDFFPRVTNISVKGADGSPKQRPPKCDCDLYQLKQAPSATHPLG
jgi:hypothetical protein